MGRDGGLYRGDAPVSLPGMGGAPPRPYVTQHADDHAADHATGWVGVNETLTRRDQPPGVVKPRRNKGGIAIAFAVLLLLGFGLYATQFDEEAASTTTVTASAAPGSPADGTTILQAGETASVYYAGQPVDVTLLWSERQDGSWVETSDADPALLVAVRIEQPTDVDAVTIPGWNWSIRSGDQVVEGAVSNFYEPSFQTVTTVPGSRIAGLVAFDTEIDDGVLELRASSFGAPLASWQLPAPSEPVLTVGELGSHTTAEIGRPGFSTKISDPRVVSAAATDLPAASETGSYLEVDVEVWSVKDADGYLGMVKAGNFVFRAADGTETDASIIESTLVSTVITSSDPPQGGIVAFDTTATAGAVLLRDGLGRDVTSWDIDLG